MLHYKKRYTGSCEGAWDGIKMTIFRFNPNDRKLLGPGCSGIDLRGQTLEVFRILLENAESVVTKAQIRREVWGSTSVTDDSLIQCISEIRKVLGPDNRHLITTFHGRGYRLSKGVTPQKQPIIDFVDTKPDKSSAKLLAARSIFNDDAITSANTESLVGRDQEFSLLKDAWSKVKSGNGQAVHITGQAGIGKSAITHYFVEHLYAHYEQKDLLILPLQCSQAHSDTSWWPLIQLLLKFTGFNGSDDDQSNFQRLVDFLGDHCADIESSVTVLGTLLGLSAEVEKQYGIQQYNHLESRYRIKRSMRALLFELSTKHPILLILEDIHWIDPSSLDFTDELLDELHEFGIMLLINSRPSKAITFSAHPAVTDIRLNPLAENQLLEIARRIDKSNKLTDEMVSDILTHAAGIPLYAEELSKSMVSDNLSTLDQRAPDFNLNFALLARVESRSTVMSIMQIGACIGRSFNSSWISRLTDLEPTLLQDALESLVRSELVHQRGVSNASEYSFKHELIRQAARNSLDAQERKLLFKKLLKVAESVSGIPDEIKAQYSVEANKHKRASRLWEQCGDKSVEQSALAEARIFYQRAIKATKMRKNVISKSRELDLQVKLCHACLIGLGFSDKQTIDAFSHANRLLNEVGENNQHRFTVLYGRWLGLNVSGQLDDALQQAYSLRPIARQSQDKVYLFMSERMLAITSFLSGRFHEAKQHFEQAFNWYSTDFDPRIYKEFGSDIHVTSKINWAQLQLCTGDSVSAFKILREIEDQAIDSNNKHLQGFILARLSILHQIGKSNDCEAIARRAIVIGNKYNLIMSLGFAHCALGAELLRSNRFDEALDSFKAAISFLEQSNTGVFATYYRSYYATCLANCGQITEACNEIKKIALKNRKGSDAWAHGDTVRMIGEFEFRYLDNKKESISSLEKAYTSASKNGALLWTLRLSVSLAKMYDELQQTERGLCKLKREVEKYPVAYHNSFDFKEAKLYLENLQQGLG